MGEKKETWFAESTSKHAIMSLSEEQPEWQRGCISIILHLLHGLKMQIKKCPYVT